MSQSRSKIVHCLTVAKQDQQPVTVRRKHLDADMDSGFVLAITDEWVIFQDLAESVGLDAVVLLRLDHVTKVEPHENRAFVNRAVAGLGVPLAEFECPPEASTGDLLRLVTARAGLVCIYLETRDDYWLNIGRVLRIAEKRMDLHFIGRDGVWADFVDSWKLSDITRIEFGGRYIQALEEFGEPARAVKETVKR
jgi:hypothetical protein